ncbi:MAG TPA: hypothetical protein PKO07_14565 [Pseudomonadota bacterium]|nr:hypothetical protein [Pseudomonadota bacterium]HNI59444.1 hypothetical protein [Pseudomonadota bacterium]HNN52249.1 hypothetical protein [Pseudomonadota bacterium]
MKTQRLHLACLFLVAAAIFLSARVHAAPPSSGGSLTAEQHIEEAQKLFKEQQFSEAGEHLLAAHESKPQPVLLFNAGQAYRKALRPIEARNAYQKLIDDYPSHPLVPESKGYVQTLDALIAEVKEKQQIELALTEQKSKTEKELAEERARREEVQKELSKYKKPFYKKAWFWLLVSGVVVGGGVVALAVWDQYRQSQTKGGTQHLPFSLTVNY